MRSAGPTRNGVNAKPLTPAHALADDEHPHGHGRRAANKNSSHSNHRRGVCQHWNGSTCALETSGKHCPHRSTHWEARRNTPPRYAIAKYMLRVQHELKPKQAAHRHVSTPTLRKRKVAATRASCPPPPTRKPAPAVSATIQDAMLLALIQQQQRQQQARLQEEAMRQALAIVNGIVAIQQQQLIKPSAAPSFVLTQPPATTHIKLASHANGKVCQALSLS